MDPISQSGSKKSETPKKSALIRRRMKALLWIAAGLLALVVIALTALYFYMTKDIPTIDEIRVGCLPSSVPELARQPLPLAQIPLLLQKAFLAMDDSDFYDRKRSRGLIELIRYSYVCSTGRVLCCDTSIARQVARQCRLAGWHRNDRLIKLPILQYRLETSLTKDELLGIYLNQVYLGRGAYGVEAAALAWFDKPAAELSLAEMAQLAAVVKDPINTARPDRARIRRLYTLERMQDLGFISEKQTKVAKEEEIIFKPVTQ